MCKYQYDDEHDDDADDEDETGDDDVDDGDDVADDDVDDHDDQTRMNRTTANNTHKQSRC